MACITFLVTFRVKADIKNGEVVCITGNCDELGNWNPNKGVPMQRDRENKAQSNIWMRQLRLSPRRDYDYRFFISRIFDVEDEGSEKNLIVVKWETNIPPRMFSPRDYCECIESCADDNISTFGSYNGNTSVTPGWLTGQTQIRIMLTGNALEMWKSGYRDQQYRIKCSAIDQSYREHMAVIEEDSQDEFSSSTFPGSVFVSKLNEEECLPKEQNQLGEIYKQGDFLTFSVQTFEPDNLGFHLSLSVHDPNAGPDVLPRTIGYAYILPHSLKATSGSKVVHITGLKHKPIGQLTLNYLLVHPLTSFQCNMAVSFQHYWQMERRTLEVGHRGLGESYKKSAGMNVRENTIASLMGAASHGADYVEFDLQLTKDHRVVVYHDWHVCLTLRRKQKEEHELFKIPVKDLTLAQLQAMKLNHPVEANSSNLGKCVFSSKSTRICAQFLINVSTLDLNAADTDPLEHQPFPTIEQCFIALDDCVGFNIELKYPQGFKSGKHEMEPYFDCNEFINIIVKSVMENAGNRRIIFSCFDLDTCILLQLKQNKYPVLFLTQGETKEYEMFLDWRTRSIQTAVDCSRAEGFLGISAYTPVLLSNTDAIRKMKDHGLILFCWGTQNNDKATIKRLKGLGLDGICYDRIDCYKSDKENVFKMEKRVKIQLLQDMGKLMMPQNVNRNAFEVDMSSSASSGDSTP